MKKFSVFLCLFIFTGCTVKLADVSVISTKRVSNAEINLNQLKVDKNVLGESSILTLWNILSLGDSDVPFYNNLVEAAVTDALNKGNGDLLIDGQIFLKTSYIPPFFFLRTIKVQGNVVNTKENIKK